MRKEARHLGWDRHFSKLIGALDAENDKPSTKPVAMALADFPLKEGPEIWFVGDADIDMECAVNAGLAPVLLRNEAPMPNEFENHSPVYHIEDCLTLSKCVGNM